MRLTRAGEYGIRCVFYLAGQPGNRTVNRREIAEKMDIPFQFLGKIGQKLGAAGIIRIEQGVKGGFLLNRSPEQITLLDVIEAIEGEIFLNDCILNPDSCHRSPSCPVHQVWLKARDDLRETLSSSNFADMVACEQRYCSDQTE